MSKNYYPSLSLAVLVGADQRLKKAHQQSVNEAVKYCEEYIQMRGGALATGNGQHHKDETEIDNDLTPDPNALDCKL